jgi:hypothetical protein
VRSRLTPSAPAGRHDAALRRRALRKGRERGCSIYIAADELAAAGIDPYGPPPLFRVWPGRKRSLLVALYPQPATPADEGSGANAA